MVISSEYCIYALAGAIGGFVAGLVRERGCIVLPELRDRRVYLNSLAGIVMGSVSGIIGDATVLNAFMWGTGASVTWTDADDDEPRTIQLWGYEASASGAYIRLAAVESGNQQCYIAAYARIMRA